MHCILLLMPLRSTTINVLGRALHLSRALLRRARHSGSLRGDERVRGAVKEGAGGGSRPGARCVELHLHRLPIGFDVPKRRVRARKCTRIRTIALDTSPGDLMGGGGRPDGATRRRNGKGRGTGGSPATLVAGTESPVAQRSQAAEVASHTISVPPALCRTPQIYFEVLLRVATDLHRLSKMRHFVAAVTLILSVACVAAASVSVFVRWDG